MGKQRKDSDEVVKFMALFERLRSSVEDTPDRLTEARKSDPHIANLCLELEFAAFDLKLQERRHRRLFSAPTSNAFLTAWRDYEARYQAHVEGIGPPHDHDNKWARADDWAQHRASGIEEALEFARFNADQHDRWEPDQREFIEKVIDGVREWREFKAQTGFDLRRAFRRRELVPFVLVPRGVSQKHGGSDPLSMLAALQHAQEAFILGATHAALGLMRAIVETVLRDHYQADGGDLSERIRNAAPRLPGGANVAALHRLRILANAIVHLDREKGKRFDLGEPALEREVISLFFVVRDLIEGTN